MIIARALKARAALLIAEKKHKQALDLLARLPEDIEARCVSGELLMGMLRYEDALACFDKCMALDPQSAHPHGVRARVLIRRMQRLLEDQLK